MNLLQDLSRHRFKQPLLSLIPIGSSMAWPMRLENDLWYLPFFTMERRENGYVCNKESEIMFSYPEFQLYLYHKCESKIEVYAPLSDLLDPPEQLYSSDLEKDRSIWSLLFLEYLPNAFVPFYPIDKECEEHDHNPY